MITYRKHGRTLLKCEVKLEHEELGELVAEVRDVSDTGVFVTCRELVNKISVGDALKAKTAPGVIEVFARKIPSRLTVVRLTEDGVGFAYD